MSRVVEIPASFDDRSFEQFAQSFSAGPITDRMLFDARGAQWASPLGLLGMLTAGQAVHEAGGPKPVFAVPLSDDVRRYWVRTGFFGRAAELFELNGKLPKVKVEEHSDVLLDVTPIRATEDVHSVVGRIQERSARILVSELGIDVRSTIGFAMALSEACQNIVEHAGTGGWVAAHVYNFRRTLGRKVAVIAVSDAGVGFRRSLEATQSRRFGDRWGDGTALEAAVIQGVSRFRDPGRGQGLAGIKRYLTRWRGKLSIRSGTARIAIVPEWDDEVPLTESLAPFPGAQLQVLIPAQEGRAE
jgi:anti-sigma regulatory factor (Ser/Thr protein kinase)